MNMPVTLTGLLHTMPMIDVMMYVPYEYTWSCVN